MDPHKTALLIIDMQKDVLKELVKSGITVVSQIQRVLHVCRKKGVGVVYLTREHRKSGIDVEKFRLKRFNEHPFLVIGTEGAEMIDDIKPVGNEPIVPKTRFSGFFQSDLLMILMRMGVTTLVLCGVQTPNCIRGTVTDALAYDYEVILLEDAIAAQTPEVHQANLYDMRNMGAVQKTVDAFLQSLG